MNARFGRAQNRNFLHGSNESVLGECVRTAERSFTNLTWRNSVIGQYALALGTYFRNRFYLVKKIFKSGGSILFRKLIQKILNPDVRNMTGIKTSL